MPSIQCAGLKKDGSRCGAWAVPGRADELCAGHAGLGAGQSGPVGDAMRAKAKQARADAYAARVEERSKTLLDRIAAGLEERAQDILAAYLRAGLEKGDWRALEALITRVYGKPVERTEDVTQGTDIYAMSEGERNALRAKLIAQLRDPTVTHAPRAA